MRGLPVGFTSLSLLPQRALRGPLHGPSASRRAGEPPLPGLVQFTEPGRFVCAKLAQEDDQALLHGPLSWTFEVVALDGEEPIEYPAIQGGDRGCGFDKFGFVSGFERGEPSLIAGVELRLVGVVAFESHASRYAGFVTDVSGESSICKSRVLSVRNDLGASFRASCRRACTCPSWLAR